jgi:hypothetical protein
VALHRGIDGSDPLPPDPAGPAHLERRPARTQRLASGTLACPSCDAPVVPAGAMSPADPLSCAFCDHAGAVREFLSLAPPTRPTRVVVRIVHRRAAA